MKAILAAAKRLLHSEEGPTATEYAVLCGLLISVCALTITALGRSVSTNFHGTEASLNAPQDAPTSMADQRVTERKMPDEER
jgi:Flp pilus assembly pilin Flp